MFDLEIYRKSKNLTQSDLADVIGINRVSISKAERGELAISRTWLEKLNEKYGDIDFDQIGDALKLRNNQSKGIPYFDVTATGSDKAVTVHNKGVQTPSTFINVGDLMPKAECVIRVAGNSMTPNYPSGSLIGLRKISDGLFDFGAVYVIETEDNRFIKRIFKGKDDDHIQLYSDNDSLYTEGARKGMQMYENFDLHKKHIKRVFKVVGRAAFNDHSHIPEF